MKKYSNLFSKDHVVYFVRCMPGGPVHVIYAGSASRLTLDRVVGNIKLKTFVIMQRIDGEEIKVYDSGRPGEFATTAEPDVSRVKAEYSNKNHWE